MPKKVDDQTNKTDLSKGIENARSLNEVPVEKRKKDAKELLYLKRYE